MAKKTKWAIIGGGKGGQSAAGHLALMGYPVRLYDLFPKTVDTINEQGGIRIEGVVQGFGKLEFATTVIGKAVQGADVVMVMAPASAHGDMARDCAPHLAEWQMVVLHPGATCGALEFKEVLRKNGCTAEVPIAETNRLIYTCTSPRPGHVEILGIREDLTAAALPARSNDLVLERLQEAFPRIKGGRNVIETSLANVNAIMHPAPSILNLSLIESRHEWLYYHDGITPTVGAFVEDLDRERVALGKSFGLDLLPVREWFRLACGGEGDSLCEVCRRNPAYEKIKGQKELRTRYLLEDIPYGLVPMIELGRMQGMAMERMDLMARLGQHLLRDDSFIARGRTLKSQGVAQMSSDQFTRFLETGER